MTGVPTPAGALAVWSGGHVDWPGGVAGAIAQLPLRARAADGPAGAVAVVAGGRGWPASAEAACAAGVVAVVVVDPVAVPDGELERLIARSGDVPIVLDRERMRHDVAADAARNAPAPLYTAQCAAPAAVLAEVVRDAVGWLRVLSGGGLRLRSSTATAHGVLALFDAGESTATLTATALAGTGPDMRGGGRIAACALGVVRTDVEIAARRPVRVVRDDGLGAVLAPARWEAPGRLALRRAIEAVYTQQPIVDVAEFVHDTALGARLRTQHKHG